MAQGAGLSESNPESSLLVTEALGYLEPGITLQPVREATLELGFLLDWWHYFTLLQELQLSMISAVLRCWAASFHSYSL